MQNYFLLKFVSSAITKFTEELIKQITDSQDTGYSREKKTLFTSCPIQKLITELPVEFRYEVQFLINSKWMDEFLFIR